MNGTILLSCAQSRWTKNNSSSYLARLAKIITAEHNVELHILNDEVGDVDAAVRFLKGNEEKQLKLTWRDLGIGFH